MIVRQVTPPITLPFSVADARRHLRVLLDAEDAEIWGFMHAAVAYAERTTGRCYAEQEWEAVLTAFPSTPIILEPGPVTEIVSVSYTDVDSVAQVLAAEGYAFDVAAGSLAGTWPTIATGSSIRIRYRAGGVTPLDVRHAMLLLVGHWYENRGVLVSSGGPGTVPFGVETLLGLNRKLYA